MKTILLDTSIDYTSWDINEAESVEMTDWQPIETAPRDGTIILVAIEHYDGPLMHDIVWWNDHYDYWESAGYDWKPMKYDQVEHIFHWMPLPPPPKKGDE